MNTISTIKITRPPEISYDDPCPVVLKDTFKIALQALWLDDRPVDLTSAKIYVTIKASLSDADVSAKIQKNSTTNPSYFSFDSPTNGRYSVAIPVGELIDGGVTYDTNYYIDTFIVTASYGSFTHLYDLIRPFKPVTDAES